MPSFDDKKPRGSAAMKVTPPEQEAAPLGVVRSYCVPAIILEPSCGTKHNEADKHTWEE